MQIHALQPDDTDAACRFLCDNGWARRIPSEAWFAELVRNSQRSAVAKDGGLIVGFGRALTDGLSNGYLSMLAVAPGHQRQGIGRALAAHLTADSPDSVTWVLRAERPGAQAFFEKLGFKPSSTAMERRRHAI